MSRPYAAAAAPLDDGVLLEEILLCLPPNPSSLPRASLVCKRWRGILSDPGFLGRFRKHHSRRNEPPPLLGFFDEGYNTDSPPVFKTTMGQPDRVPPPRFSVPWSRREGWEWDFQGCRHGLALLTSWTRREAILWDPITGHQRRVAFPPGFSKEQGNIVHSAAVMCAAAAKDGHVHGDCRFTPFRLALVGGGPDYPEKVACLYDSESGVWGDIVSVQVHNTQAISNKSPSVLVRDAFCWVLDEGGILQFDFQRQSLVVTQEPADAQAADNYFVVRTEHGGLGLAVMSEYPPTSCIQLWERKSNCDGVVGWELQKTIQLDGLFSEAQRELSDMVFMQGYDEDTNAIFLSTRFGDWMLQLDCSQFINLFEIQRDRLSTRTYYPYRNFYILGSGDGGAEM